MEIKKPSTRFYNPVETGRFATGWVLKNNEDIVVLDIFQSLTRWEMIKGVYQ
jgi:hypothetical protein